MADCRRSVEFSVRMYEALIRLYPTSFRREYGSELSLLFREQIADARGKRRAVALIVAWLRVLNDLAWTVPDEQFQEIRRRIAMRSVALAVLSVVLAAVVFFVIYGGIGVIVMLPLAWDVNRSVQEIVVLIVLYLAAFLSGLILTRVKPFFAPLVTVPIATMAIWGLTAFSEYNSPNRFPGWGGLVLCLGFVASTGFTSLLGCIAAEKMSAHLAKLSVRWFQLIGPLAILICTSFVALTLRLMFWGNQISSELERPLAFCLFALVVIGAVTVAHIVLLFVRSYRRAAMGR